MYVSILQRTLLPFIREVYPDGHRFMQVVFNTQAYISHVLNYLHCRTMIPKHVSNLGKDFLEENEVKSWKTPPESPDPNPIEKWHELKEFIRREVKLKTEDELVDGIKQFWGSVSGEKGRKYIRHLHKVVQRVIEVARAAIGY